MIKLEVTDSPVGQPRPMNKFEVTISFVHSNGITTSKQYSGSEKYLTRLIHMFQAAKNANLSEDEQREDLIRLLTLIASNYDFSPQDSVVKVFIDYLPRDMIVPTMLASINEISCVYYDMYYDCYKVDILNV